MSVRTGNLISRLGGIAARTLGLSPGSRQLRANASAIYKSRQIQTEHYFLDLCDCGGGPLVVTFEPAGAPRERPDGSRPGWGATYLYRKGVSHLAIKPKVVDWYRRGGLIEAITEMRERDEFAPFSRIITYGASMGGYGALAFAGVLGADAVIALNPQSTLNRKLVPWENRYGAATREDWQGPLMDAALECGAARDVYVVVDRWFDIDRKHIDRLPRHNLHVLNVPFVQHRMPAHLVAMKAANMLVEGVITDSFDATQFRRAVRARRDLKKYFNVLDQHPRVQKSPLFTQIVATHRAQSPLLAN